MKVQGKFRIAYMSRKIKKALLIAAGIVSAGLVMLGITACRIHTRMGELPDESERQYFSTLPNYQSGVFVNEEAAVRPVNPEEPARKRRKFGFLRHLGKSENAPAFKLPTTQLTSDSFDEIPSGMAVYWLGHSSLIIELDGVRFMTDPVFGSAAPVSFAARRYVDSPLSRKDLPPLDFIIISHDHYDHLEYDTVIRLKTSDVPFVVPLGVGSILQGWGIRPERIHELNWGDSVELSGIRITAETARHFSGRTLDNRNSTLWASFVVESAEKKLYFGADSGYGKHFRTIGEQYGPFDLVFLEIDAWNANWPNNHLFPEEAITAFHELRGKHLFPIHWGVFDLAGHPWDESIKILSPLAEEEGISFITPEMGEKVIPGVSETGKWWEDIPHN